MVAHWLHGSPTDHCLFAPWPLAGSLAPCWLSGSLLGFLAPCWLRLVAGYVDGSMMAPGSLTPQWVPGPLLVFGPTGHMAPYWLLGSLAITPWLLAPLLLAGFMAP